MPAADFYAFSVYEDIEPFGDRRAEIHAGDIQATFANCQRTKETDKVWTANDFMRKWGELSEVRTEAEAAEQERKKALIWAKTHNARLQAKEKREAEQAMLIAKSNG